MSTSRTYDCIHCGEQLDSARGVLRHLFNCHQDCMACHAHWLALSAAHTVDVPPSLIRIETLDSPQPRLLDDPEVLRIVLVDQDESPPASL